MDLNPDQRGFLPVGAPDIGAAEYQGLTDIARLWKVDPDGDGIPYGIEQATGTDNFAPNSGPLSAPVFLEEGGGLALGFPLAPAAESGTRWIVTRSTDLTPGSFQEIYRFDGTTDTAEAGITFDRTAAGVTITDTTPPAGSAFYRLEAILELPPEP